MSWRPRRSRQTLTVGRHTTQQPTNSADVEGWACTQGQRARGSASPRPAPSGQHPPATAPRAVVPRTAQQPPRTASNLLRPDDLQIAAPGSAARATRRAHGRGGVCGAKTGPGGCRCTQGAGMHAGGRPGAARARPRHAIRVWRANGKSGRDRTADTRNRSRQIPACLRAGTGLKTAEIAWMGMGSQP